ncbi:MAG: recB, partial [Frankiales bacterium]|nr:recB [Frankiales bacterium]
SYLDAVRVADVQQTLATNYRSDAGLLSALEQVYGGAELGDPRIVVHPVVASRSESRLPGQVPFRLRVLAREPPLVKGGYAGLADIRRRVATDLADDVVRLLESRTAYEERPVAPGDIAVLVRKNSQTALVREALEGAGVPSVLAGSTSVFATPSATDWLRVLQAVEQPHRAGRVRLAALTPLIGWTATSLDQASDDDVARLGAQLRDWAALFEAAGFAAVFERLATSCRLESRLLAVVSGERRLTDVRHLAQALNRAAVEDGLGLSALTAWLADRVADPAAASTADRSRRLESDAAAVQIVTVHASKGLEFPVVYLPYGWDGARWSQPDSLLLHDAEGRRVRDLGGKGSPGWDARKRVHDAEESGDDLRLLYVALTRAKSQVVAWWAPSTVTSSSALHRLLMGRSGGQVAASARTPPDDTALAALRAWAGTAGGAVSVEPVGPARRARWAAPRVAPGGLAVARSTRALDQSWRRTSYSALTAAAHDAGQGVGSEAEHPEKTDEPETTLLEIAAAGPPSTMNAFAGGAAFGTLVHEVLEHAEDPGELLARCREAVASRLAAVDPAALAEALLPVLHTPLGVGTLASIPVADRLAELDFELPLAGGDLAVGDDVTLTRIAGLLRGHLAPDDVLAPYADLLETVEAPPLRGYLSGSIDVVLRVAGPRYVVVDYKTNRLARGDLTALHYSRNAMAAEMMRAHYPLQALLYCVALHRYLRWRQPGYDARTHLGGVQYLFVRGMVGPLTPPGCGVFDWQPPAELVVGLSDLLAGG